MQLDFKLKPTDDPRRIKWLEYFRQIADLMGLKDWIIAMSNDPPSDKNAFASVYCVPGRKYAWIRVDQAFLEEEPESQRIAVLHELIHCHEHAGYSFAQDHLPEDKKPIHNNLMEYGVDGIACAIANYFPLPDIKL